MCTCCYYCCSSLSWPLHGPFFLGPFSSWEKPGDYFLFLGICPEHLLSAAGVAEREATPEENVEQLAAETGGSSERKLRPHPLESAEDGIVTGRMITPPPLVHCRFLDDVVKSQELNSIFALLAVTLNK